MIRRISMLMTGAAFGALALVAVQTGANLTTSADAAGSETYRQLDIFGDIFERVRSQYVESPEDQELIKNAINGMLQGLDPPLVLSGLERVQRYADLHVRQVRRPGHRSDDGK